MYYKDPPIHPQKGQYQGACNRTACQALHTENNPTSWYNRSTRAYYCERCADLINRYNPEGLVGNLDYMSYFRGFVEGSATPQEANTRSNELQNQAKYESYRAGDPICVERVS